MLACVPPVLGSECYSLKDADQKNACLAEAKADTPYCYRIKAGDRRDACLAQAKRARK